MMSKTNPKKAMEALLPLPIALPCGETVRPMTLGMYAALERIGSSLVTGQEAKDTLELIPSLYLLTHDPREVFRGNILELAMAWADTKPVSAVEEIRAACLAQVGALTQVVPQASPEELKKNGAGTTDGSPRSRPSPPKPSAGASKRSSGTSRRAPSRS